MESIRHLLPSKSRRIHSEHAPKYEPLCNCQNHSQICLCSRCGNPAHVPSSSESKLLRVALHVAVFLLALASWTLLVGIYFARNPELLHSYSGRMNLVEKFPIVPTDFQPDNRFVETDPFDSPFWLHDTESYELSDKMEVSAWNYYGNDWIWLRKGSPYAIPGGRELIPLREKDAWMKNYLGYIPAYQHEMHCVGLIKHVLNAYQRGENLTAQQHEHANSHCLEVIRHAVMCHPDLTLAVPTYDSTGSEKEPFWGGEKHMCRDQKKVHTFLASRNMGFKFITEGGKKVIKAWSWPLPTDDEGR